MISQSPTSMSLNESIVHALLHGVKCLLDSNLLGSIVSVEPFLSLPVDFATIASYCREDLLLFSLTSRKRGSFACQRIPLDPLVGISITRIHALHLNTKWSSSIIFSFVFVPFKAVRWSALNPNEPTVRRYYCVG